MKNIKINYNEIEYIVFYHQIKYKWCKKLNKSTPIKFHIPLFIGLMDRLTEQQKIKLITKYNNLYIINFSLLLNLYIYDKLKFDEYMKVKNICLGYNDKLDAYGDGSCICTQEIEYPNIIYNIETKQKCIIGCDCIEWWQIYNEKVKVDQAIKKTLLDKTDIPNFCYFCSSKRSCMKCKTKEYIRNIFNNWRCKINDKITYIKNNINCLVQFGKYNGKTFNILCKDINYRNFILSNNFNNIIKEKINIFINYEKQILKYIM